MEFKDKLKTLRKLNNLTQEALANKIHVSRSTIAKWEAGLGLPQRDSFLELCKVFNVEESDLICANLSEEDLIIKNLKIHTLNKKIFGLSITFSLLIVFAIIITSLIVSNIKDVNNLNNIYNTIHLANYKNVNLDEVSFAGEIKHQETLLKNNYGYAYQDVIFEKIKYTDKSSLILIKVYNQFTPGRIAYLNGDTYFKSKAYLDSSFIEIEFNNDVNIIYSWPKIESKWIYLNSKYSQNIIYDFSLTFTDITLNKIDNQLQFYYDDNIANFILSGDKKTIIREFDVKENLHSTLWNYTLHNEARENTLHTFVYYLIEVNDEKSSNKFEFTINTGMTSGGKIIERKQYITCFL